jgi:hypothetical protein
VRLPQPSVASDNNEASMQGSTNHSPCEATMASPSALAAMSFTRVAVQSQPATCSEAPMSTSKNLLALLTPWLPPYEASTGARQVAILQVLPHEVASQRLPHNVRTRFCIYIDYAPLSCPLCLVSMAIRRYQMEPILDKVADV